MVEYVADFALAGERALADERRYRRLTKARPGSAGAVQKDRLLASRLVLFRLYYLGGAEYLAARRLLGLSELTWSDWSEEDSDARGPRTAARGNVSAVALFSADIREELICTRVVSGTPGQT